MTSDQMNEPTNARVPVPLQVFVGIEAVRLSGATNMLDRHRVAELAEELGYVKAAVWVRANRELYARAIFNGFEPRAEGE